MNADQLFILTSISRGDIANILNNALDEMKWDTLRLYPSDSRLTDQVCNEVASQLGNVARIGVIGAYGQEEYDVQQETHYVLVSILVKYFVNIADKC